MTLFKDLILNELILTIAPENPLKIKIFTQYSVIDRQTKRIVLKVFKNHTKDCSTILENLTGEKGLKMKCLFHGRENVVPGG